MPRDSASPLTSPDSIHSQPESQTWENLAEAGGEVFAREVGELVHQASNVLLPQRKL